MRHLRRYRLSNHEVTFWAHVMYVCILLHIRASLLPQTDGNIKSAMPLYNITHLLPAVDGSSYSPDTEL